MDVIAPPATTTTLRRIGFAAGVLRMIRRTQPDVIFGWMYYATLFAALAGAGRSSRVIASLHHVDPRDAGLKRRTRWITRACRLLAVLVDQYVYVSDRARKLHERAGFPSKKSLTVPGGVPISTSVRRPHPDLDSEARSSRIVHVARWHPDKDQATLLRALGLLAREGREFEALLIGRGFDAANEELQRLIGDHDLAERVRLLGEQSNVAEFFEAEDIFCLSSRSEALPISLLEAMSRGLVPVVTDVGSCKEVVEGCGLVVPPENPAALREALAQALDAPLDELSRCAQRRARDFDIARSIQSYAELVRSPEVRPKILMGVTAWQSRVLLEGQPEYFDLKGWDTHVVSGVRPAGSSAARATDGRVSWHEIEMEREPAPLRDVRSLRAWFALVRRQRPEVVLVGTPKAALLGLLASFCLRIPVRVYLIRGFRHEGLSGIRRLLLVNIERLLFALSTHQIAVSPSLRAVAVSMGVKRPPAVLGRGSSNGVAIPEETPVGSRSRLRSELFSNLDPDTVVVGFAGRLVRDKGILDLVEACLQLDSDSPVALVVFGGTEDEVVAAEVRESLAGSHVPHLLCGHVTDWQKWLPAIDVFVLPSYREGLSNVVLEASAAGVPVVVSDATGCPDAVEVEVSGLVYPVGDVCALATAIDRLVCDAELRSRMGANGREWVTQNFARPTVWQNYEKYLRSLLEATQV